MAHNVVEHNDGLINQYAYRQRQATQGHAVDRVAGIEQAYQRHQNRQGDGQGDDKREPYAAKEDKNNQTRENRTQNGR